MGLPQFIRTDCLLCNFFRGFSGFYESFCFGSKFISTRLVQLADDEYTRLWQLLPEVLCHGPPHDANADNPYAVFVKTKAPSVFVIINDLTVTFEKTSKYY